MFHLGSLLVGLGKHNIYTFNRFVIQEYGDFTWRVTECEELVGGLTGFLSILSYMNDLSDISFLLLLYSYVIMKYKYGI